MIQSFHPSQLILIFCVLPRQERESQLVKVDFHPASQGDNLRERISPGQICMEYAYSRVRSMFCCGQIITFSFTPCSLGFPHVFIPVCTSKKSHVIFVVLLCVLIEVDECSSYPCQNGGTCVDKINDFICLCRVGFIGTTCETGKYPILQLSDFNFN